MSIVYLSIVYMLPVKNLLQCDTSEKSEFVDFVAQILTGTVDLFSLICSSSFNTKTRYYNKKSTQIFYLVD